MSFLVNDQFEHTFIVSVSVYEGFIQIFKDQNPLHTDEKFAMEYGFEGKVMHGNILSGFLSAFIGEGLPTKNVIIHSQEIIFKSAVYLNDELFFSAQVTRLFQAVSAVEFKFSFKNKQAKVIAKGNFQIGILK